MLSTKQAIEIIKRNRAEPKTEMIPLVESGGRVLAEDIFAPEPSPRYTNSAMDGFAVKWADIASININHPVVLQIVGESQAGIPYSGSVQRGQAIRISTGAVLSDDVDTVVRMEDTESNTDQVTVFKARNYQQDIRKAGEEFVQGDLLLKQGSEINPPQLALLATVGIIKVLVYCRPEAAVIITGTELVPLGKKVAPHQIRDSNVIMLSSAINFSGGSVTFSGQVEDSLESTAAIIREACSKSSVLIFSGGVSVGVHDHVKEAAELAGFTKLFWRVRQKPGKPLFCARRKETLLFGLPGNPVSAFMGYIYYVQPLIWSMQGKEFTWRVIKAQVEEEITNRHGRTNFFRAILNEQKDGRQTVKVYKKQGSHMLTSVALSDGFIIIDENTTIPEGSWLDVYLFPWKI